MANKKTRALNQDEFEEIISTMIAGFTTADNARVKPNARIATALVLEANLGLRIGDIVKLRLSDIVFEGGRYHLDMVEEKTKKSRTFLVPNQIYIYIQNYALERGIKPRMRLFDLSVRAVQSHLKLTCDHLGIAGISTHSFRKFFAQTVYEENNCDISLIRELLQHSSLAITQRYLGVSSQRVEQALQNHIVLPE